MCVCVCVCVCSPEAGVFISSVPGQYWGGEVEKMFSQTNTITVRSQCLDSKVINIQSAGNCSKARSIKTARSIQTDKLILSLEGPALGSTFTRQGE